ncbi:hypothetical protein F511_07868 [Dorcoceras hygrometricum]|uniref:Uncharacterized protein n=1 Tax=Dorcoceras hygrometricum TaxID=472368 RepID=A0A2Z7DDJ9_9LAMI|nr:hypothetical protein F511_07868 [Dorcoceras hygrometricum]
MDSKVQSMDSKVISLDSKVEELLNIHTFMKHDFNTYKRAFYEKMDTVAVNVDSSQTSLETSLVRQFTEHQLQIASELDFVKLQLAKLVNHLKEVGDAKKGEGPSSRQGEGSSNKRGEGTSLVRQFTEHQLQIASELDFVKLQLAKLVNHLKEVGDAKKGEGPSSRQGEGSSNKRGEGTRTAGWINQLAARLSYIYYLVTEESVQRLLSGSVQNKVKSILVLKQIGFRSIQNQIRKAARRTASRSSDQLS